MTTIPASTIREIGTKGTYRTEYGAVGLGYNVGGIVYKSGGNGFYYPVDELESWEPDDGLGYAAALNGLAPPPAYTEAVSQRVRRQTKELFTV